MAFIPPNAQWYLADLVVRITVEGDPRPVVHVNMVLIRADSPEEAYAKSLARGRDHDAEWMNSSGQTVHCEFLGLRDLNVIHDPLEDGAELAYEEHVGPAPDAVASWIRPRETLAVFAPIEPPNKPDYGAWDVEAGMLSFMRGSRNGSGDPS